MRFIRFETKERTQRGKPKTNEDERRGSERTAILRTSRSESEREREESESKPEIRTKRENEN